MIQLVTFDLDNTLWETESVVANAERVLADWLAKQAPDYTAARDLDARKALLAEVLDGDPDLRHRVTPLRIAVLELGLRKAGYPADEAQRLARAGFEVFIDARHRLGDCSCCRSNTGWPAFPTATPTYAGWGWIAISASSCQRMRWVSASRTRPPSWRRSTTPGSSRSRPCISEIIRGTTSRGPWMWACIPCGLTHRAMPGRASNGPMARCAA